MWFLQNPALAYKIVVFMMITLAVSRSCVDNWAIETSRNVVYLIYWIYRSIAYILIVCVLFGRSDHLDAYNISKECIKKILDLIKSRTTSVDWFWVVKRYPYSTCKGVFTILITSIMLYWGISHREDTFTWIYYPTTPIPVQLGLWLAWFCHRVFVVAQGTTNIHHDTF